jgi:hypothetical protein
MNRQSKGLKAFLIRELFQRQYNKRKFWLKVWMALSGAWCLGLAGAVYMSIKRVSLHADMFQREIRIVDYIPAIIEAALSIFSGIMFVMYWKFHRIESQSKRNGPILIKP